MILCDTNILIEFYKANLSVIQTLQHKGSANIAVSVITKAELFSAQGTNKNLSKLNGIYRCVTVMGLMMPFQHFLLS
jgi:tRNA(fMet)-specific endonuclease VapC